MADFYEVGRPRPNDESTVVIFSHPSSSKPLAVHTGIDQISWGYGMNTANFPTYGGEVVQILSCYIEDLQIQGTLRNYKEMQTVYDFFLRFIDNAGGGNSVDAAGQRLRDETPMKFYYPHRNWDFDIFVKEAPGYRRGRDVVAPTWKITAHIVDHAGNANDLASLIRTEAEFKSFSNGESFDLEGKMFWKDENPFSDPTTRAGSKNDAKFKVFDENIDKFTKLLPSYLNGDFDSLFSGIGSKPAFNSRFGIEKKGSSDKDEIPLQVLTAAKRAKK